jgi:bacterioferritin
MHYIVSMSPLPVAGSGGCEEAAMQAKEGVIDRLNAILSNELTAINQYVLHSGMVRNWGYERLYGELRQLGMDEMKDTEHLIDHILYLEGLPNMQRLGTVQVGETVLEHLQLALQLEQNVVTTLTEAITHCAQVGDYTTRNILEEMVRGQEEHINWLETQLEAIEQVGLQNYLAQQINKEG